MAAADADRAVLLDEVGVADGEIWFAQCVNVLLLFTAWSRTAVSLVYTLISDLGLVPANRHTESSQLTRTCENFRNTALRRYNTLELTMNRRPSHRIGSCPT